MEIREYERIQRKLSELFIREKMKWKGFNSGEREAYKKGILACKSVLSNFNPAREYE